LWVKEGTSHRLLDSVIGGVGWTAIESGPGKQTLVAGSGSTLFDSRRRAEPGDQYRTFRR